jgi:acyl CoA:acetate/3-ketoacid CoA transferase alpha subunit
MEGQGRIFTEVDPDLMRECFRCKSKKLTNKVTSAKEAVRVHLHDGDYLAVGGFGGVRIPTALLHEIVRQGRKGLGFAGHTATHDCEILAAGKCFNRCDVAYIIGLEARGIPKMTRKYFESGAVECTEWTNAALSWRLRAAAMGVSFIPARSMLGTDTELHSAGKEIACPFTGKKYLALPALFPDVAIIHVHEADIYGNCHIHGILVSDQDLARASKTVIISAERLVSIDFFRDDQEKTTIPYYLVDAVVEAPYGSYPGNMPYEYYSDEEHLQEWLTAEENPETYQAFLTKYLFETRDFDHYLELCGGTERMKQLRDLEYLRKAEGEGAD